MGIEVVTKEDLQMFRIQLLDDLKRMFSVVVEKKPETAQWLKSAEVRKMLKVSPGTLQNLRVNGELNGVKIQGTWYYNLEEINALFEKGK